MRVAVVHEWLVDYSGSERIIEQLLTIFPRADLFAVVDFLPARLRHIIGDRAVKTTWIQKLPFARRYFRAYLPLMPLAIEQLDLSSYDLVISNNHAVSKGVRTGPNQLHICNICTPMRYAWDLREQYLQDGDIGIGIKGWFIRKILRRLRAWDARTARHVDEFVAISEFIRERVRNSYGRDATVIYPPVDVDRFLPNEEKADFYLTAGRLVSYKRVDLIVEAFQRMPDRKLVVIGEGPSYMKIKKLAGPNVQLLGYQPFEALREYMQRARAFVFAAEEDFGIAPVEAQACGTPVIAFRKGGAWETIKGLNSDKPTGVFFERQTVDDLVEAVRRFEIASGSITSSNCRANAMRFSCSRFRDEFRQFVHDKWNAFRT